MNALARRRSPIREESETALASNAKKKTTFAKLNRENALRERRERKQAKKQERRQAAAAAPPAPELPAANHPGESVDLPPGAPSPSS